MEQQTTLEARVFVVAFFVNLHSFEEPALEAFRMLSFWKKQLVELNVICEFTLLHSRDDSLEAS